LERPAARGLHGEDAEGAAIVGALASVHDRAREAVGIPVGEGAAVGVVDRALTGVAAVVRHGLAGGVLGPGGLAVPALGAGDGAELEGGVEAAGADVFPDLRRAR